MKTLSLILVTVSLAISGFAKEPEVKSINLSLTPERSTILNKKETDIVFSIGLQAPSSTTKRKHPLNISLVLDRSGSMDGAKLEKARQAAALVVRQLTPDDIFSLVVYDDQAEVLIPPRKVENPAPLIRKIESITSGGSTALHSGVQTGAAQVREFFDKERVNRVILLSDGLANVGPKTPSALAELGKELKQEKISVSTIGLGDDYNEDLMVALAEASAANYYYVKDAEKLPGIFAEELNTVQSLMAREIRIRIQIPENIASVEIVGNPEIRFKNGEAEIVVENMYDGQKKEFLVRGKLKDANSESLALSRVELDYLDARLEKTVNKKEALVVNVTKEEAVSDKSRNTEISARTVATDNTIAREQALKLADEGRTAEAITLLQQQAKAVSSAADVYTNNELKKEASSLIDSANELQTSGGFSGPRRKSFQYENYNQKNQRSLQ